MPLGSLTSSLGSSLSSIVGGLTAGSSQPAAGATQPSATGSAEIEDVSQDRFDLTTNPEDETEPELPVAAYGPPAGTDAATTEEADATAVAPQPPPPPTPPSTTADADAAALVTEDATETSAEAVSGANSVADTTTGAATSGTSADADPLSLWSDEEQARAMALKALDQERRMNVASYLTSTEESHVVALTKKADAQASTQAAESKRPALLVA